MAKFEFYREYGAKPYIIDAETKEDAQSALFSALSSSGKEDSFSQYKTKDELAQTLRDESEAIQKAGTAPFLNEEQTPFEKVKAGIGGTVGGLLFPATMAQSENKDESTLGMAKKAGAGVLDVASNFPIGRGIKVASKIGREALGIGADIALGTAQGVASGQDAGESAAMSSGVSGGIRGGVGATKLLGTMGKKGFAKFAGSLSGSSPDALLDYAEGGAKRKAIVEAAGTTKDITKTFIDDVTNPALTSTDKPEVIDALRGTVVDISPVIEKLKSMKEVERDIGFGLSSSQKKYNEAIDRKIADLSPKGETWISGNSARIQRAEELDADPLLNFSSPDYDKSIAGKLSNALKESRKVYAQLLIDGARPEYRGAMESWSKKIQTREKVLSDLRLGDDPEVIRRNAEKILGNLFGKNKSMQQEALQEFDNVFGRDYIESLKNAYYADQLGISKGVFKNQPSLLPMQTTGARNTGIELMKLGGGAGIAGTASMMGAGGVAAGMIPLVAAGWSPNIATRTLSGFNAYQKGLSKISPIAENIPASNIMRSYSREKEKQK